jgi:hypothetical protein
MVLASITLLGPRVPRDSLPYFIASASRLPNSGEADPIFYIIQERGGSVTHPPPRHWVPFLSSAGAHHREESAETQQICTAIIIIIIIIIIITITITIT